MMVNVSALVTAGPLAFWAGVIPLLAGVIVVFAIGGVAAPRAGIV